jgi:hypothetical protein
VQEQHSGGHEHGQPHARPALALGVQHLLQPQRRAGQHPPQTAVAAAAPAAAGRARAAARRLPSVCSQRVGGGEASHQHGELAVVLHTGRRQRQAAAVALHGGFAGGRRRQRGAASVGRLACQGAGWAGRQPLAQPAARRDFDAREMEPSSVPPRLPAALPAPFNTLQLQLHLLLLLLLLRGRHSRVAVPRGAATVGAPASAAGQHADRQVDAVARDEQGGFPGGKHAAQHDTQQGQRAQQVGQRVPHKRAAVLHARPQQRQAAREHPPLHTAPRQHSTVPWQQENTAGTAPGQSCTSPNAAPPPPAASTHRQLRGAAAAVVAASRRGAVHQDHHRENDGDDEEAAAQRGAARGARCRAGKVGAGRGCSTAAAQHTQQLLPSPWPLLSPLLPLHACRAAHPLQTWPRFGDGPVCTLRTEHHHPPRQFVSMRH